MARNGFLSNVVELVFKEYNIKSLADVDYHTEIDETEVGVRHVLGCVSFLAKSPSLVNNNSPSKFKCPFIYNFLTLA